MCGRFTVAISRQEMETYLKDTFGIDSLGETIELPRYNVAPGQDILSVISDGRNYRAGLLKWGFVPSFSTPGDTGYKMINAKAETLRERPAYINSFKHRRCVILADGFYEWHREGKRKTPFRIVPKQGAIFPMAGLWNVSTNADGSKLYTCTIITTEANKTVSDIHDRMPVILTDEAKRIWLDPANTDPVKLSRLLVPAADDYLNAYRVSVNVNSSTNEGPGLIEPLE